MAPGNETKRRLCRRLIFVSVIGSLMVLSGGMARAKPAPLELCVNPAGTGGCATTIQGAVGMVPAKGSAVITIAAGVYAEDVTVNGITVSFIGVGAGMTVVDGTNTSGIPAFLFENKSNGELHEMTIENGDGKEGSNIEFMQYASSTSNKGVGTLKIENCEITGGTRPSDFGGVGAVAFAGKTLVVDSSSISNNLVDGLVLLNAVSHAYITNTIFNGNTTSSTAGLASGCGIHVSTSTLVLNNDTITDNHCVGNVSPRGQTAVGGGIFVDYPGKVTISNTVIANNTVAGSSPSGPDCFAPGTGVKSAGHNLIENISMCNIKLVKSDVAPGTPTGLGGLTTCPFSTLDVQTPMVGSALVATGNPGKPSGKVGAAGSSCLPLDECGTVRVKGDCNIGASQ